MLVRNDVAEVVDAAHGWLASREKWGRFLGRLAPSLCAPLPWSGSACVGYARIDNFAQGFMLHLFPPARLKAHTMEPQSLVTRKAWSRYVTSGTLGDHAIRPEVADSWQRCRMLRLDPLLPARGCIGPAKLCDYLEANQDLVEAARPTIQSLYRVVAGSNFQVVLTDARGVLLEVLGDQPIIMRTQTVDLCPGGDWSENIKGTNAIGTAIVERRPLQIHASEHYLQQHHFLTCCAAPIFDVTGELIGALDISGDSRLANTHTLGMVVSAVHAIESDLRLQHACERLQLTQQAALFWLNSTQDGFVSMDRSGVVTEINKRGAELLGTSPPTLQGRPFTQITGSTGAVLRTLSDGIMNNRTEMVIDSRGERLQFSITHLRDNGGKDVGTGAVFHPIRNDGHAAPFVAKKRPHWTAPRHTLDDIVGDSPSMGAARDWAMRASRNRSAVLILGETGTGKELFAQAIHRASDRRTRPFVAVNCAALPESLVESELFGYEDGSFTGARRGGRAGKFEQANGGTVLLDEIGDMTCSAQTKLLRVIQEQTVVRVGGAVEVPIDVRIIAATHRDLLVAVEKGSFRQDLYYRLQVLEIRIPPLRERLEDIPQLVRHLARKIADRMGWNGDVVIHAGFLDKIRTHQWPGNVRELENAVERAMVQVGIGGELTPDLLSFRGAMETSAPPPPKPIAPLRHLEKEAIRQALARCHGNIKSTSEHLGIGRNTLYRKMKEYGIAR